jgi:uncharacterized protein GlcG (DUF336 family)
VLAAALAKAEEIGVRMGIAVADAGANLVGFIKMDGAFVHPHYNAQGQGLQRRLSRQSPCPITRQRRQNTPTRHLAPPMKGPNSPPFQVEDSHV